MAFPHLKPTATSWPARRVLELAFPHLKPTATTWSERGEGEHVRLRWRRAVATSSLLRGAWLRETALSARDPFAELEPWPMGTAHEARVPFVEIGPGLRGTALATQVPFACTAPCEYATDGVSARELEREAICAALLDRLAAGGARAPREKNGGIPHSANGGRVTCYVPPSSCQFPVRKVPG